MRFINPDSVFVQKIFYLFLSAYLEVFQPCGFFFNFIKDLKKKFREVFGHLVKIFYSKPALLIHHLHKLILFSSDLDYFKAGLCICFDYICFKDIQ